MLICKLDWLSFTWKSGDTYNPEEFSEFLKVFPEIDKILVESVVLKDTKTRGSFYDVVLGFNDFFSLSFCNKSLSGDQASTNMGVHVDVPAHGLEYFCSHFDKSTDQILDLISLLRDRGCKFTRLDFAYDDFSKTFTPHDFGKWFYLGQVVSNFHRIHTDTSKQKEGGTFYIGTRSGAKMLRIYDKAYESKGVIDSIRYEFVIKSKYTASVVDYMITNGHAPFFRDMMDMFIIRINTSPESDVNKYLDSALPEWVDFLNASMPSLTQSSSESKKFTLTATKQKECNNMIVRNFRWYNSQVWKSMASYFDIFGEEEMVKFIRSKLDSEHAAYTLRYFNSHKDEICEMLLTKEGNINPYWKHNLLGVS